MVANLGIGIVGAMTILRVILHRRYLRREEAGFGSPTRTGIAVASGLVLGLAFYTLSGGPTSDPIVLMNAFAQVLVVSAAEVIVCWVVVGTVFEAAFRDLGRFDCGWIGRGGCKCPLRCLSLLAQSAVQHGRDGCIPSVIGLVTSLFFFLSRDVYGTVVFHNFLGVLGVANALAAEGKLQAMTELQPWLLATAATTVLVLVGADRFIIRRALPSKHDHGLPQRAQA